MKTFLSFCFIGKGILKVWLQQKKWIYRDTFISLITSAKWKLNCFTRYMICIAFRQATASFPCSLLSKSVLQAIVFARSIQMVWSLSKHLRKFCLYLSFFKYML